jgi:hypothetical protein
MAFKFFKHPSQLGGTTNGCHNAFNSISRRVVFQKLCAMEANCLQLGCDFFGEQQQQIMCCHLSQLCNN